MLFQEHANGGLTSQKDQPKTENWTPVSSSRKAKWWYSSFHNVTAMVGAGVLGLPFALAQLGWYVYTSHNKISCSILI